MGPRSPFGLSASSRSVALPMRPGMREDRRRMTERLAVQVDGGAGSASARVRPYQPGDEDALVAMFRSTFPEVPRSLDDWRWCFRQAPEGPADICVLESDGRVVGTIAHVPVAAWIEGQGVVSPSDAT